MLRMTDQATALNPTAAEHDAALYKEGRQKTASFAKTSLGWLLMTLGSSIMLVAVITVLSLALPKAAGLSAYVVVSGSMEPEYPVNCVVYAEKTEPSKLAPGDVIIFNNPSRGTVPITHRVVANDTAQGSLITKGDANKAIDAEAVSYDNVIGKVIAHIPYLGYTVSAFSSFAGRIATIFMLMGAWLLLEAGRQIRRQKTIE